MKVSELRVGLLFYIVGPQYIYVNVLNQTGERHFTKLAPVEQIWPHLDQLIRVLRDPSRCSQSEIVETFQCFSHEWGRLLLPPLEHLEPFDVLIFIPHHFLHYVPFHLVSLNADSQYIATRFGISYCSSATLFTRAVERNIARRNAVSSCEFSLHDTAADGTPAPPRVCISLGVDVIRQNDGMYAQLARRCARHFSEHKYLDGRADLKNPFFRDADVICLVCHGHADTFTPNNSGLLLKSAAGREINIPLDYGSQYLMFRDLPLSYVPPHVDLCQKYDTGREEAELMTIGEVMIFTETQAQLVLLLGCSTAAGQILSGDAFGSLAYQWLQAGAASVLAHQWEADFGFVSEWIPLFLDNWVNKRQPKAIAMRESMKQLVEEGPNSAETLHIWGAVTLLGDWL
jgi:CHAT domain-containing protein